MIEDIAAKIDPWMLPTSGKVFYAGREAFRQESRVYVLGANPGGDPSTHAEETIGQHTDFVLNRAPAYWSAYADESWLGRPPGAAPLQRRLAHLLEAGLGLDLRVVPASNLIFTRSRNAAALGGGWGDLMDACWPVHREAIERLRPRAIICLGVDTAKQVLPRLNGGHVVGRFREQNARGWESLAWKSPSGIVVFGLTHAGRVDWTNPATDPAPMVRSLLGA